MSEQIRRNYPEEYRNSHAAADIPVGVYGEPEDLAVLAVFLTSPLAYYISGTVIPVDGGLGRYAFRPRQAGMRQPSWALYGSASAQASTQLHGGQRCQH